MVATASGAGAGTRSTSVPATVGLVGGVLLIVGAFMTWVTVTLNFDTFAKVMTETLHVPVSASDLTGLGVRTSQSAAGTEHDGKLALVAGLVAVVCAVLLFAVGNAKRTAATVMLVAGILGAGVVLYNVLTKNSQIDDALAKLKPQLAQLGISIDAFKSIFSVSWGIGIYVCLLGGMLAIVAWAMARASGALSAPSAVGGPMGAGTGFARSAATSGWSMPTATTPIPASTMPEPTMPAPPEAGPSSAGSSEGGSSEAGSPQDSSRP